MPPVPPKPPKRGILKGPRTSTGSRDSQSRANNNSHNTSTDTTAETLIKNTLQNELITYENVSNTLASTDHNHHTEEVRPFRNYDAFCCCRRCSWLFVFFLRSSDRVVNRANKKNWIQPTDENMVQSLRHFVWIQTKKKEKKVGLKLHEKWNSQQNSSRSHEMSLSPHNLWLEWKR